MKNVKKTIISDGTIFGTGLLTEVYGKFFKLMERHAPTDYDKIMDKVYNRTDIGGGGHRTFDGSHTFAGSYQEIQEQAGHVEVGEYIKSHFNELVTPEGIPLFTLDKQAYDNISTEISDGLGNMVSDGQVRSYIRDMDSFNAGEMVSGTIGILFLASAMKSGDKRAISRVVAANMCVGLYTANPLQLFVGMAGLVYGIANKKIECWELLKGSAPVIAGITGYQLGEKVLEFNKGGAIIFSLVMGVATSALLAHLDRAKQQKITHELGENNNYIAVMTPNLIKKEIDIFTLRRNSLSFGI